MSHLSSSLLPDADIRMGKRRRAGGSLWWLQAGGDPSALCPSLVILDINLPKMWGGRVLEHIRRIERSEEALVIVVSSPDFRTTG